MKKISVLLISLLSLSLHTSCFLATDSATTTLSTPELLNQAREIASQITTLHNQLKPLRDQLHTIRKAMKENGASREDMKALNTITQAIMPRRPEGDTNHPRHRMRSEGRMHQAPAPEQSMPTEDA
jgi:hypothetical protein